MSSYLRMKRLSPWHLQLKKGKGPLPLSQPQFVGTPGWLLLTHGPEGKSEALFVDTHEKVSHIPLVLDERLFSDTVLRVIRISPTVIVVCDVQHLNGKNLFETMSFADRKARIADLLEAFHHPDLTALVLPEDAPHGTLVRGYESYDESPGTRGVFLPAME